MPERLKSANRNATLHDVAARSGVSYQTVSRVVNDLPDVATATRERVLRAMLDLGYRPNLNARQLVRQRSTVVGVITFATGLTGPTQILINVEQVVRNLGLSIMFCGIREESNQEIRRAVDELCSYQVVGILIHLPLEADLQQLRDLCRNVHLVAVDSDFGFAAPSAFVNQQLGSRRATAHLIGLGHRQTAYIRAPLVWRAAHLRFQGWRKELKKHRLPLGPVADGDWSAGSGFEAANRLLADHWGKFTCVVAANDEMALGAIRAFEEKGVGVPWDISVVGFDDLAQAAYFRPPLTTVHQDFHQLAVLSVEQLMRQINGEVPSKAPIIRPELVERSTTAPPRKVRTGRRT
jgi:DNA-binding LacI/PurR family transcriptional regulator